MILFWTFFAIISTSKSIPNDGVDESISFSLPHSVGGRISEPLVSFWQGVRNSQSLEYILRDGMSLNLHVTSPASGLLLYAIDINYRTLWLEFLSNNQDELSVSYYSFEIGMTHTSKMSLRQLCSVTSLAVYPRVDLRVQLIQPSRLLVTCNNTDFQTDFSSTRRHIVFYSPGVVALDKDKFRRFVADMRMPVPDFKETPGNQLTYIWIGNVPENSAVSSSSNSTPGSSDSLSSSKSRSSNFYGCIQSVVIGNKSSPMLLPLATGGQLHGNAGEIHCKPTCSRSSCHGKSRCQEMWRSRFQCDCRPSRLVGRICNEDHCRKVDGTQSLRYDVKTKMDRMQFSFMLDFKYRVFTGYRLLSVRFVLDTYIHVFIASDYALHVDFVSESRTIRDVRFEYLMEMDRFYTLFCTTSDNSVIFELAVDRLQFVMETKSMSLPRIQFITSQILVADTYPAIVDASIIKTTISKLHIFFGSISNLMLTSRRDTYLWSEDPAYSSLAPCRPPTTPAPRLPGNGSINGTRPVPLGSEINLEGSRGRRTYTAAGLTLVLVLVGAVILVLMLVGFVAMYVHVRRQPSATKIHLLNDRKRPLTNSSDHFYPSLNEANGFYVPPEVNSIYTTYKPSYKARSMSSRCNTPTNPRSGSTSPMVQHGVFSTLPRMASPEDSADF